MSSKKNEREMGFEFKGKTAEEVLEKELMFLEIVKQYPDIKLHIFNIYGKPNHILNKNTGADYHQKWIRLLKKGRSISWSKIQGIVNEIQAYERDAIDFQFNNMPIGKYEHLYFSYEEYMVKKEEYLVTKEQG